MRGIGWESWLDVLEWCRKWSIGKDSIFLNKGQRGRFFSCCHRALGKMICWARVLLLICAYGYKDVKSGSDLHWFPLPWKPLSYSWTKEGGQEVGGFEKRLQIYLYCWMSRRKTLPSFWLKNYTPWDNYEHFSKFWVLRHCWAGLGPLRSLWCLAKTTSGEWYPTCSLLDGRWR